MKFAAHLILLILGPILAHAAPGFWGLPVDGPLSAARDATVQILVFSDEVEALYAARDVRQVKPAILAMTPELDRPIRALEFANLGPNNQAVLAKFVKAGSGLIVGNAKTILTAGHVFGGFNTERPKVMIIDHRGRVLLDTRFRNDDLKAELLDVHAVRRGHALADLPNQERDVATDAVLLRSRVKLAIKPVRTAALVPAPGTPVFLISYPAYTVDRRALYNCPDSAGHRLCVSVGKITAIPARHDQFLRRVLPVGAQYATFTSSKIFADPDLVPQSSGGPIFDGRGKFLGIMTSRLDYGTTSLFDYAPAGGHGINAVTMVDLLGIDSCEVDLTLP